MVWNCRASPGNLPDAGKFPLGPRAAPKAADFPIWGRRFPEREERGREGRKGRDEAEIARAFARFARKASEQDAGTQGAVVGSAAQSATHTEEGESERPGNASVKT
jgi:hypothetical protein